MWFAHSPCLITLMQVTWSQATSPVLERNITEVVPTSLRLNTVYIEVKTTNKWDTLLYNNKRNNLQVYINWLYLIFLYLTPISILIIFNIRIYRWKTRITNEYQGNNKFFLERFDWQPVCELICQGIYGNVKIFLYKFSCKDAMIVNAILLFSSLSFM